MPDVLKFSFLASHVVLGIVPGVGLWILMLLERTTAWRWRTVVAPHLLEHLVRHPGKRSWTRPTLFALPGLRRKHPGPYRTHAGNDRRPRSFKMKRRWLWPSISPSRWMPWMFSRRACSGLSRRSGISSLCGRGHGQG